MKKICADDSTVYLDFNKSYLGQYDTYFNTNI